MCNLIDFSLGSEARSLLDDPHVHTNGIFQTEKFSLDYPNGDLVPNQAGAKKISMIYMQYLV